MGRATGDLLHGLGMAQLLPLSLPITYLNYFLWQEEVITTKPAVQVVAPAIKVTRLSGRQPTRENHTAETGRATGDRSQSLKSGINPPTATRQPVKTTGKLQVYRYKAVRYRAALFLLSFEIVAVEICSAGRLSCASPEPKASSRRCFDPCRRYFLPG